MIEEKGLVALHRLCLYCRHFLHTFDRRLKSLGPENYHTQSAEIHAFHHLPDIQCILESAYNGCHLCSIFSGRLKDKYGRFHLDAFRLDSPFLVLRQDSQTTKSRPIFTIELYKESPGNHSVPQSSSLVTIRAEIRSHQIIATTAYETQTHDVCGEEDRDRHVRLIQHWINQCCTSHSDCRMSQQLGRPTRLLDIQSDNTSLDIRLVDGSQTFDSPYATLSYRWGSRLPLTLLPTNINSFKKRIPYASLPKTFQDAIEICRKLSIRYLWIDSLCIIQGVLGDFEKEAAKMESVYAGSFITIAAAEAVDSWQGFLSEINPLQEENCLHVLGRSNRLLSIESGTQRKYLGEYALDRRGWAFQERLLSPRSLYFSSHGVEWECRQCTGTTSNLVSSEEIFVMGQLSKRLYAPLVQLVSLRHPRESAVFQRHWNDILMQYTRTSLSYSSDKLPALAGVSAIAERKFRIRASFGLWLKYFTSELLWTTVDGGQKPQATRVYGRSPSWSWASIEGAVEKHHITGSYELSTKERQYTAKVVVAPPATSFTNPPATWAPIGLRGPVARCVYARYIGGLSAKANGKMVILSQDTTAYVDSHGVYRMRRFSEDIELEESRSLVCLLIRRVIWSERRGSLARSDAQDTKLVVEDVGLVLASTGAHSRQFERVGLYDESAEIRVPYSRRDISAEIWARLLSQLTQGLIMFPANSKIREATVEIV